jgi:D-amino-acid dehydrogenase
MPLSRGRAVVVGAGIVGLSTALYLQQDDWQVVLIEREGAVIGGTALGSAGLMAVQTVQPLALPSLWKQMPHYLLDPESPVAIRLRHLPRALPWLVRLLQSGRPQEVERLSVALAWLLRQSYDGYADLLTDAEVRRLFRRSGLITIYRSEAQIAAARAEIDLRQRRGIRIERLESDDLHRLVPALGRDYRIGLRYTDCGHVPDLGQLMAALAGRFRSDGGQQVVDEVRHLGGGNRITRAVGKRDSYDAEVVVVAAGAWSAQLTRPLGLAIPLDTERGYHVMLPKPGVELPLPVIVGDMRFAMTPMAAGLRLAGTIELAGLQAPPNPRRHELLIEGARRCLPELDAGAASTWMGFRPSLPDSLPVISGVPGHDNVFLAFGHGHLGLTLGAITGRLVRDLIAGRAKPEELRPFRADRF